MENKITKIDDVATVKILNYIMDGIIIPLYSFDTMLEYKEVLNRKKINFDSGMISYILLAIEKFGILVEPSPSGVILPDNNDVPFLEIVLEKKESRAYLVTGNIKHFVKESFVVTPAEFIDIINRKN